MKRIEKDFGTVLSDSKCEFFGNVWVGNQEEAIKHKCYNINVN